MILSRELIMTKENPVSATDILDLQEMTLFDRDLLDHAMVLAIENKISNEPDFDLDQITLSIDEISDAIFQIKSERIAA
tara:strand:+ start:438 stop:674 length:237 start_codon:yes stop_codon:yes gene_type:complete